MSWKSVPGHPAGCQAWALYSAYPDGFGRDALDLRCPGCGSDEIERLAEIEAYDLNDRMLGDRARCWTCKREFTVTGNCWKPRPDFASF